MSYFMKLTAKETAFLLYRIASLRVTGTSWEMIAGELKLPINEMREFLFERDAEFALWMKKARREHREFCVDEAVEKLRHQCQSSNEKIRQSSACTILRLHMAEIRHRENIRKAKLKKSLPPTQKKTPPNQPHNEAPKTAQPVRTLPAPKLPAPASVDFSQLPSHIQQQTADMAKLLQVKI